MIGVGGEWVYVGESVVMAMAGPLNPPMLGDFELGVIRVRILLLFRGIFGAIGRLLRLLVGRIAFDLLLV
jgi:hypothetical protein